MTYCSRTRPGMDDDGALSGRSFGVCRRHVGRHPVRGRHLPVSDGDQLPGLLEDETGKAPRPTRARRAFLRLTGRSGPRLDGPPLRPVGKGKSAGVSGVPTGARSPRPTGTRVRSARTAVAALASLAVHRVEVGSAGGAGGTGRGRGTAGRSSRGVADREGRAAGGGGRALGGGGAAGRSTGAGGSGPIGGSSGPAARGESSGRAGGNSGPAAGGESSGPSSGSGGRGGLGDGFGGRG
jgi:hypothetical protein